MKYENKSITQNTPRTTQWLKCNRVEHKFQFIHKPVIQNNSGSPIPANASHSLNLFICTLFTTLRTFKGTSNYMNNCKISRSSIVSFTSTFFLHPPLRNSLLYRHFSLYAQQNLSRADATQRTQAIRRRPLPTIHDHRSSRRHSALATRRRVRHLVRPQHGVLPVRRPAVCNGARDLGLHGRQGQPDQRL